ncbi:unnamed protein product [Ectocarpus sp. 12 AP-2014]
MMSGRNIHTIFSESIAARLSTHTTRVHPKTFEQLRKTVLPTARRS